MAQTPAQRKAAQRRLAKEIRSGTYKPSAIGKQAREAAGIKRRLKKLKETWFGNSPKWNKTRSDKQVDNASLKDARKAVDWIERWVDDPQSYDWEEVEDDGIASVLFYH